MENAKLKNEIQELKRNHAAEIKLLQETYERKKMTEIEAIKQAHAVEVQTLKDEYENQIALNKKKQWVNTQSFKNINFEFSFKFSLYLSSVRNVEKKDFIIAVPLPITVQLIVNRYIGGWSTRMCVEDKERPSQTRRKNDKFSC